jgi:DNA repair protein RecO (recombination protein O)
MLLKTRGIVIRTLKYAETSVIADILTEERGLHSFIGSGVRTAKARMPFNLFQPMTVVDMVSYFRDDTGTALHRLKEMRADTVWQRIPFEVSRGAVALFMAEVCRKSIQEAEENRELFDFLMRYLQYLDLTTHPIANIHLNFLLGLSAFLGFQPMLDDELPEGSFFDLKEGVFLPEMPSHGTFLSGEATTHLLQMLQTPLENCHEVPLSRADRKLLLDKLLMFYQLHIPNFGTLNTPSVLETVFG